MKKIKSHCQNDFNYEEAKEKVIDENYCEETKEDAIERLSNYCEEYCLNCLRKKKKSMNVRSNHRNPTYYELEIKVSKVDVWKKKLIEGIDYYEERHIICDYCFEKLSENKDKNNLDHEGTEYKIICLINLHGKDFYLNFFVKKEVLFFNHIILLKVVIKVYN